MIQPYVEIVDNNKPWVSRFKGSSVLRAEGRKKKMEETERKNEGRIKRPHLDKVESSWSVYDVFGERRTRWSW